MILRWANMAVSMMLFDDAIDSNDIESTCLNASLTFRVMQVNSQYTAAQLHVRADIPGVSRCPSLPNSVPPGLPLNTTLGRTD